MHEAKKRLWNFLMIFLILFWPLLTRQLELLPPLLAWLLVLEPVVLATSHCLRLAQLEPPALGLIHERGF